MGVIIDIFLEIWQLLGLQNFARGQQAISKCSALRTFLFTMSDASPSHLLDKSGLSTERLSVLDRDAEVTKSLKEKFVCRATADCWWKRQSGLRPWSIDLRNWQWFLVWAHDIIIVSLDIIWRDPIWWSNWILRRWEDSEERLLYNSIEFWQLIELAQPFVSYRRTV